MQLTLRTPREAKTQAPTGSQRGRPLTINHFWVLSSLATIYEGNNKRARLDHFPQYITLPKLIRNQFIREDRGWI